jgi:hypothetical protein
MPFENLSFRDYIIASYLTSWLRALALCVFDTKEYNLTFWQSQATHLGAGLVALGIYLTIQSAIAKWHGGKEVEKRRVDIERNKSTQNEKVEKVHFEKN